jgi:hypothetical protein
MEAAGPTSRDTPRSGTAAAYIAAAYIAAACTAVACTVTVACTVAVAYIVAERYPFMPLDEPSERRFKPRAKPSPKRAK